MTSTPATPQGRTSLARARNPIQTASILVLLVAVAGLQLPAPPVAGQAGPELPAVEQAAPSESSAPSADTDRWRLDDVRVVEFDCNGEYTRDEYGVFESILSVGCEAADRWPYDKVQVQGTMTMGYPEIVQGGQPATFTVEANGSMKWEMNQPTHSAWGELYTRMATAAHTPGRKVAYRPCERWEIVENPPGGASGSASLKIDKLTCTYDPAVDFGDGDKVDVTYSLRTGVTTGGSIIQGTGKVWLTYKRCTNPDDCEPPEMRRPVLIIPGIYGSYCSSTAKHEEYVLRRGVPPDWLVIDPLKHTYDDLIETLENVGYRKGKDLFLVAYDWRLRPGPPVDGEFDGHLKGLTGVNITDDKYECGVDYLGYWLKKAAEAWQRDHPGKTLEAVDVISHSTGGLVARSYIQSDAYGDTFSSQGKTMRLPLINNLIMVAVPNRGASLPWQAMHNNFIYDLASRQVFSDMLNIAYQKVKGGKTITGFPQDITPASIKDRFGNFRGDLFIDQYVPTFRSLLATYNFYVGADGIPTNWNMESTLRNDLLLDLNSGLDMQDRLPPADASPFADQVGTATVIYAKNQSTPYRVREAWGPVSNVLWPLDAWEREDAPSGLLYYEDINAELGDDTVPSESAVGQFKDDKRVAIKLIAGEDTTHTGLMSNKVVQQVILKTLKVEYLESDISTGLAAGKAGAYKNVWSTVSDPVEMFLVDGSGRRLGYSNGTGPLTEIPNSVWYGGADGLGWVFDAIQGPLSVEMTGLGEDYYLQVSGEQVGMTGGMEASGSLAKGKKKTVAVETQLRGTRTFLPMIQRNYGLPPVPSTGWQTILHEGFEAPLSGPWVVAGDRGWGRADCRAFEGTHSLSPAADTGSAAGPCPGGYPNNLNAWLIYGPFDLAGAKAAEISFQRWQRTQKDHDEFSWMVSVDDNHYWGLSSTGDTGGWDQVVLDLGNVPTLGDLRGQRRVWLALIFESDGAGSEEGVFIDDLRIRKKVSTSSGGSPGRSETSALQAVPASLRRPGSNH